MGTSIHFRPQGGDMKRDMDLLRQIMIDLESDVRREPPGYNKDQINYNKWLLIDSGMAIGSPQISDDQIRGVILIRLTWKGCEFLDLARNEEGWQAAKHTIRGTVEAVSVSLLSSLLNQWMSGKLGLV